MIILKGKLRQSAQVTTGEEKTPRLKVWVEHEQPRDNGPSDLRIEELFLPVSEVPKLVKDGSEISLVVRPYASGTGVKFSALEIVATAGTKAA